MSRPTQEHQLLLLRHAKSAWDDPALADADRPLTGRGSKAATAIGHAMLDAGLLPDKVLCSPARRARDTWAQVSGIWPHPPEARIVEALYDFGDGSALLRAIRAHGGKASALLVVGHNPALHSLALRLAGSGDDALIKSIERKYPTAALAVFAVTGKWSDLLDGGAQLRHFIRPRDLKHKEGA